MDPLIQYLVKLGMSPYEAMEYARKRGLARAPDKDAAGIPGNVAPYLGGDRARIQMQKAESEAYERRMVASGNHKYAGLSPSSLATERNIDDYATQSQDPWDSPTTKIRYMLHPDQILEILKQKYAPPPAAAPAFLPSAPPAQSAGKELNAKPLLNKLEALRDAADAKINDLLGPNPLDEMKKRTKK